MTARGPGRSTGVRTAHVGGTTAAGQCDRGIGRNPSRAGPAPFLSLWGVLGAFGAAVLLCWPMLLVTAPMGYFDTTSYHNGGGEVVARLAGMLGFDPSVAEATEMGATPAAAPASASDEEVRVARSFLYAAFAYLTARSPLGLVLTMVAQTALTLVMLLPLVPRIEPARRWVLVPGLVLVGGLSTLPWFASYAMPDILGAALLLYAMLLVGPMDALGRGWQAFLTAIACFAALSHYGNIPLAGGLLLVVLVLRIARGRSSPWLLGLAALPVLAAMALNLLASAAALGEASVMPKRLPLMLARSVADGPGARYLDQACAQGAGVGAEAPYAICEVMPDRPRDLGGFLWTAQGIGGLTIEELDRVRDEEGLLLWHIFRAYPAEQAWALLRNAALQVVMVGTGEIQPLTIRDTPQGRTFESTAEAAEADPVLGAFDVVAKAGTAIGLALLVAALARRPWRGPAGRQDRDVALVCLLGLLGNALIFGGLSAPVDRYQSRLAWIVPALGVLLWLRSAPALSSSRSSGL